MGKPLDQILVIDLEATCWQGDPPPDQEREIIEIGLCLLDVATGLRGEHTSIVVRPERSTVSPFCTALTTLTQEEVDAGIPFAEACRLLRETYHARERVWASFGDYDRQQFERQCRAQQVVYPFGSRHINVKTLVSIVHRLPQEVELREALAIAGLPLEGHHHRGVDDAWNIAALLAETLWPGRPH